MTDIINSVPFGQDNALSAGELCRSLGLAEDVAWRQLNGLAEAGAIKRWMQPANGIAFRSLFWREGAAS